MKNDGKYRRDVYITDGMKNLLVNFLCEETGLEWYMFRKSGNMVNALRQPLIDMINCFNEAAVSFDSREEYEREIMNFAQRSNRCRNGFRLTFYFNEDEIALISSRFGKYPEYAESSLFIASLFALAMKGKEYSVSLAKTVEFFYSQQVAIQLVIPKELLEKLNKDNFSENQQFYLRKAIFWQMNFGKTPALVKENESFLRVTPQKTGWKMIQVHGSPDIKTFAHNRNIGSTYNIALLNAINAYADSSRAVMARGVA